jgi:hypothetical protein
MLLFVKNVISKQETNHIYNMWTSDSIPPDLVGDKYKDRQHFIGELSKTNLIKNMYVQ